MRVFEAISFLGLGLLSALCNSASGHEMFLKADSLFVPPSSSVELILVNGTFDKSENIISRDRMQNVSVVGNNVTALPALSDWIDVDKTSFLKFHFENSGTYVASVLTRQRVLELSAEDFRRYLEHEGLSDALAEFESGPSLETVRERYSKSAKAVIQVGDEHSSDAANIMGYPAEIILKSDPSNLMLNEKISFQVLTAGNPAANQFVKVGYVGQHSHDSSGNHSSAYELRTDQNGIASFVVTSRAVWYINLIHLERVKDVDADYESNWATLTFEVK